MSIRSIPRGLKGCVIAACVVGLSLFTLAGCNSKSCCKKNCGCETQKSSSEKKPADGKK